MGVCYTLILMDESNWGYKDTDKEQKLKAFQADYIATDAYLCDLIGQWYGFAVFDVDKRGPYNLTRREIIKAYSDKAWYIADNAFYDIKDIDT